MFDDITDVRFLAMSEQELRWFDNVKKAFYESDIALRDGRSQDHCFPELCKAVDTAKTLRRSLRGEDVSSRDNKKRFVEFLNLELPSPESGGLQVDLVDPRSGKSLTYSFAELVYDIRCMIHENENLNAAEGPSYHILLDWSQSGGPYFGAITDGRLTCNGHMVWGRLRQILAKFITGIDATVLMKANLPPPERRGLVLIDPPYEVKNERELALDALRFGIRRFATGIFMIWYPVKGEDFAEQICAAFQDLGIPAMLKAELRVRESFTGGGLAGSGLIIFNPPWGLEAELKVIVPALADRLGIGTWGQATIEWLVPPKT